MAFDFFTLHSLSLELRSHLRGKTIIEVGSSDEGMGFACGGSEWVYVQVVRQGYACLLPGGLPSSLASKGGPERYLLQARVEEVEPEKRDRIIKIRLSRKDRAGSITYGQLLVELIRPHCQVVLISERSGEVLGKWSAPRTKGRDQRIAIGQPYKPPAAQQRLLPGEDLFASFNAGAQQQRGSAASLLAGLLVGMDNAVAPEVLHRAGLPGDAEVAELDEAGLKKLWEVAVQLYTCCSKAGGYVWQRAGKNVFSALKPTQEGIERSEFPSISRAISHAQEAVGRAEGEAKQNQELKQVLFRARKTLQRRIQALQQDLEQAGEAEVLEKKGHVLMAQLGQVPVGAAEVELPDIYDITGEARIKIELDPRRPPAENGKRFLKSAKKYRRRCQVVPQRLRRLEGQAREVDGFLQRLEERGELDSPAVDEWLKEHGLVAHLKAPRWRDSASAHPRRYRTAQGWSVWAGRNNKENDLLTHRLAAQNDIWFHAQGYAGAHVVLRREDHKDDPNVPTLEEAAAIAAYWSKGKTAKKVPVVYTLVKYVTRPRGGAPGQALLRREKTLVVEPRLPAQEDEKI